MHSCRKKRIFAATYQIHYLIINKMKKVLLLFAMAAFVTTGFAQKKLVLYYSETGSTKTVAEELQKQLGADIESIEAVNPYSGNFQETMQRAQRDKEPEIKPLKADLKAYDVIYLGYPIWWGTTPMIINTFLESYDFSGKTVIPYATSGGTGIDQSIQDIRNEIPSADVKDSLLVKSNDDIEPWLKGLEMI